MMESREKVFQKTFLLLVFQSFFFRLLLNGEFFYFDETK